MSFNGKHLSLEDRKIKEKFENSKKDMASKNHKNIEK